MVEAAARRMQYVATSMTRGDTVQRQYARVIPADAGGESTRTALPAAVWRSYVVHVALNLHLGGDTGVVLGYLAKVDRLHCLTLRKDQLLLDG
jgi:hypothetical protein